MSYPKVFNSNLRPYSKTCRILTEMEPIWNIPDEGQIWAYTMLLSSYCKFLIYNMLCRKQHNNSRMHRRLVSQMISIEVSIVAKLTT